MNTTDPGAKLTGIVQEALEVVQRGERVLAIIPDKTRDDNTDLLFPIADQFLTPAWSRTLRCTCRAGHASADVRVAEASEDRQRTLCGTHIRSLLGPHGRDRDARRIECGDGRCLDWWSDRSRCAGHNNKLLAAGVYDSVIVFARDRAARSRRFRGRRKVFLPRRRWT